MQGYYARAPRNVRGCTIRNESDGVVQVHIRYMQYPDEVESNRAHEHHLNLLKGQTDRAEARLVKLGGFEAYAPIQTIEVTLADGGQLILSEPFDGVHQIEHDWLFIVDNSSIRSSGKND